MEGQTPEGQIMEGQMMEGQTSESHVADIQICILDTAIYTFNQICMLMIMMSLTKHGQSSREEFLL